MDGYSASDITAVCKEAAMGPVKDVPVHDLPWLWKQDLRPISAIDFI